MKLFKFIISIGLFLSLYFTSFSQTEERYTNIALQIINESSFCSLITIDEDGIPAARMMQTLPVGDDFVIWLGTKPNTQKVAQIKANSKVSVYYTDANSTAYVNVQGRADIITDRLSKEKYWKQGWEAYYPDKEKDFALIKIKPEKLQIVSYTMGIVSTEENWRAKEIIFP